MTRKQVNPLREIERSLFIADRPQRFAGIPVGTRMTVIRLEDGSLFVHSPVALDASLSEALEGVGTIRYVVAPNRFHHLYIGQYAGCPGAELYAAPGVPQKQPDVSFRAELRDDPPSGWAGEIDQVFVRGYPLHNEVCFFHRATRTLLMSDLIFNFRADRPLVTRMMARAVGAYGRLGTTWLEPFLIEDKRAMRESIDRILEWDFDRVIMAHGQVVERDGRDLLRAGYSWL
jgi:hypothetical protein